ncbi:MAG: DEAD/DEAH box helicase [Candidatus Ancillula sp.]|jgi:transcription-repair coupling factor|nr:DEAD/DEAH box helicase [Candidatus Ancillula sp.]
MSPLELLNQIEVDDEEYFDQVLRVGMQKNFDVSSRVVAVRQIRPLLVLSLSKFRQVWSLTQIRKKLVLKRFQVGSEQQKGTLTGSAGSSVNIAVDLEFPMHLLLAALVDSGYVRSSAVEEAGEFLTLGDSVILFPPENAVPIKIEYFGDVIESIYSFDTASGVKVRDYEEYSIERCGHTAAEGLDELYDWSATDFVDEQWDFQGKNAIVLILDPEMISDALNDQYLALITQLHKKDIPSVSVNGFGEYFDTVQVKSIELLLEFQKCLANSSLQGALDNFLGVNEQRKREKPKRPPLDLKTLEVGDFLVHDYHGIGKFLGTEQHENEYGDLEEYLVVEYASGLRKKDAPPDFLFVPSNSTVHLSKYIGSTTPKLSRFGGEDFAKVKALTRRHAKDIAKNLIKIYSERVSRPGIAFPRNGAELHELEKSFKYELTPDQEAAITDVTRDMESDFPMDRLVCGDVGFGKTEVAIRAAYKAVISGYQVAIVAPTTILTSQHYDTFTQRLAKLGVNVKLLNRFVSAAERKSTLVGVKNGEVDIIIGTHALFNKSIEYKNLGLLIIDEEQRFGTLHKELIKEQNSNVDVLALSATPIPRTLEMALSGVRDISTISTPPKNRRPIITNVLKMNDQLILDAIMREVLRGGQVFLLHNNTHSIRRRLLALQTALPNVRFDLAHGKMTEMKLDTIIDAFYKKHIDVLVCTTIVETGLDISNANTLIIENAQDFGLTQLHQLRGRIGRSEVQGYAYFFYGDKMLFSAQAAKRLEIVQNLNELGSGVAIAMKDLQMRGAGNFLGSEQSGHISGVGYNLYIEMINDAVERMRHA